MGTIANYKYGHELGSNSLNGHGTNFKTLSFLDKPSIDWKTILLSISVGHYVFENYLSYRQYQVLKRTSPPVTLKAEVDQKTFDKSQDYSRAKARFSFVSGTFHFLQNIVYIKSNWWPHLWAASGTAMAKLAPVLPGFMGGIFTQSAIFFAASELISSVLGLPLDYYSSFVLEEKYGFNKLTVKLWVSDTIKQYFIGMVISCPLTLGILKIIDVAGENFIFYVMSFVLVSQLVLITIYPSVIQPLFNKMTPLEDGELKTAIEDLAQKHEFPLTELYVIDGSKRSSHSNAYFTGLPWKKSIVLFDTLIEQSTVEETVAVLAHEIGHWKLNHIPKHLVFMEAYLFLLFSSFSGFINNKSLYAAFGFHNVQPTIIGLNLFGYIYTPVDAVLKFARNSLSRTFEYQADDYAVANGYKDLLASSLLKMTSENLSAVHADWLFSAYHHSHPILPERLNGLGYVSKEKIGSVKVVGEPEPEKVEEVEQIPEKN